MVLYPSTNSDFLRNHEGDHEIRPVDFRLFKSVEERKPGASYETLIVMGPLPLVVIFTAVVAYATHHHRAPIIDLGGADELVGSLREDRTIVSIVPELSVLPETGKLLYDSFRNKLIASNDWSSDLISKSISR
ncbi:hypothetical protein Tcan_14189 [Toxocara canis]|uniref:Uncharacterized protein n=1 Tax=Toxocara canis TaxID=6265 RepID=A0A0B2W0G6_TOXCA|nr:hypothetical protein Tcan_14189 [Toxocara canis]